MSEIKDIKAIFGDPAVLAVYAGCMFEPTPEKLTRLAAEYMSREAVHIFGYYDGGCIAGVIAVETAGEAIGVAGGVTGGEIKGIAVTPEAHGRGIGRNLVGYACEKLSLRTLRAETDDDAVGFYRACGFETEKIIKNGYTRYKCILRAEKIAEINTNKR